MLLVWQAKRVPSGAALGYRRKVEQARVGVLWLCPIAGSACLALPEPASHHPTCSAATGGMDGCLATALALLKVPRVVHHEQRYTRSLSAVCLRNIVSSSSRVRHRRSQSSDANADSRRLGPHTHSEYGGAIGICWQASRLQSSSLDFSASGFR